MYKSGDKYDRLYFYFAGHGLLAPADAARGLMHTAVVPSNVYDLRDDADSLIDVDELTGTSSSPDHGNEGYSS